MTSDAAINVDFYRRATLNVYSLISSPHFIVEVFVSFGLLKNTVITSLGKGSKKVGYSREENIGVWSRPYFA